MLRHSKAASPQEINTKRRAGAKRVLSRLPPTRHIRQTTYKGALEKKAFMLYNDCAVVTGYPGCVGGALIDSLYKPPGVGSALRPLRPF